MPADVQSPRRSGLAVFAAIALGQTVSLLGSNLANFAVGVWAYQGSGSVTKYALLSFFSMAPLVVFSPWAGALVDRWDRRRTMILSDAGSAAGTLVLAMLFWHGWTPFWLICLVAVVRATFGALQFPAFAALTTQVVPKAQLGRANGMVEFGAAVATLTAPILAGFLFATLRVRGMILIEFATFLPAVLTLLLLGKLPEPERGSGAGGSLLSEAREGWTYIRERPGLVHLLVLVAMMNFTFGSLQALITPLILSFASSKVLGSVLSTAGLGMLCGGALITLWGGPRRRVPAILGFMALQGMALLVGGLRPQAVLIAVAAFVYIFCQPVMNGCSQTIWQSKIPVHLQGRVFAMRRMVGMSALPLALLAAGPLADDLFEPSMAAGGALAGSVGRLLGTGPGRGIGLFFLVLGMCMLAAAAVGFRTATLRGLEDDLPDAVPGQMDIAVSPNAALP